ncbi:hypothetical protein OKW43_008662 [Paraburkholderia sp. WC7.3g]|uniref:neuraminidase-like domain-containing protein n=1 Tax=Paraburkholderia sp. WC7.3g TaxID=2991070 RepID=UPI003D25E185
MTNTTLTVGALGGDVIRLHALLQAQGFQVSGEEVKQGSFGPETRRAVVQFQQQNGLQPTGVVDEKTATAIGLAIVAGPARTPSPPKQELGTAVGTRLGVGSPEVAFAPGLQSPQPGATTTIPQKSTNAARADKSIASPSTSDVLATGDIYSNSGTPFLVSVRGTVVDAYMTPISGAVVVAYTKQLHGLPVLAKASTDPRGHYDIAISAAESGTAGTPVASRSIGRITAPINLLLRAFHPESVQIAESRVFYNATGILNLDLVPNGATYNGPSEAELVGVWIAASLDGAKVTELTSKDIDFLANTTGSSRAQITALVGASALGMQTGIPGEVFYALAKAGFPTDLTELYRTRPKVQRRALENALDNNTIPARLRPQLDSVMEQLQAATVKAALSTSTNGHPTLGTLLSTTSLSQDLQAQFLSKFSAHTGAIEEFWSTLAQDPQFSRGATIADLQFTLQVGAVTLNHAPLIRALQQQRQNKQISSLRDLAKLNQNDWKALIIGSAARPGVGVPAEITGNTPDARATTYAQILNRIVDDAFPTAAIARRLGELKQADHADIRSFLDSNLSFDFHSVVIDQYFKEKSAESNVTFKMETIPKLKAFQRLFRLSKHADHITTLLNDGIHSSHQIVRLGKVQFASKYATALGGAAKADAVYSRASQIAMTAQHLYSNFNLQVNGVLPAVVKKNTPDTLQLPDLETLFGNLNFSPTEECSSVLGPAAYLVDILHFLRDRMSPDGTQSAKDILFKRRPDLGEIELTCDNTNTPLPYTDLVNEILENSIAPLPFALPGSLLTDLQTLTPTATLIQAFASSNITLSPNATIRPQIDIGIYGNYTIEDTGWRHVIEGTAAGFLEVTPWPQTSGSPEERAANPQHLNSDAYDILAQAVFPWNLPLNLWAETARAYLGHLGVKRNDLMTAFAASGPMSEALTTAINSEALKITTLERQIIAGTTGRALNEFWGAATQPPSTWATDLSIVRNFENASGILYADILALLASRYINPGATMNIQSIVLNDPLTTDTTRLQITNLTTDALDRIHRFVRLARKTGWSYADLDLTLGVLGPNFTEVGGQFKETFVVPLALVVQLQAILSIPIEQVLSLWYPINTVGASSLYLRLFQNPVVLKPIDPDFVLDAAGTELAIVTSAPANAKISTHIATILASLSISAKDLAAITRLAITNDVLNLANLSEMYRLTLLATATSLSISDVLRLCYISGIQPFDSTDPGMVQAFIQLAEELRKSGFNLDELDYLLRDQSFPGSVVAPLDQNVALTLDDIYNGLLKTPDPTPAPSDPVGDLTRAALSKLSGFADDVISTAMAIIGGTPTGPAAIQNANAFIDAHFASFINPTDAKAQLVGPPPLIKDAPSRFSYVLFALQTTAVLTARRNVVKQKLSTALKLEPAIVDDLLTIVIKSTKAPGKVAIDDFLLLASIEKTDPKQSLTPAQCVDQIRTYGLLAKVAMVIAKFHVRTNQAAWLTSFGPSVGWLDFNSLPTTSQPAASTLFAAWKRTADLFALRDALPGGGDTLETVFNMARDPSVTQTQILAELANRTNWSLDDLQTIVGPQILNLTFPTAYQDERGITLIRAAFAPLKRLGVSAATALPWTKPDLTSDDARAMIQAVKAKYDDATWNAAAKPLRDVLREMQRAALVGYRLVRPDPMLNQTWTTTNEMFDWFLIDIEMTPAMVTSRIKQAIGSTQLFVQRVRMNLEASIVADETADDVWKNWAWMKNYRVWEANREVFLWPENWVEPELRDDKTPEFKTLENEILKNSLTDSIASDAIIHYLEAVDQIARLEICGMCHQLKYNDNGNVSTDIMHVFGRTYSGKPQIYYYRRWDAIAGVWSAWQKIDLDIDTQHLVPVIYEGRLYLFWSIFTSKSDNPPFQMPNPGDNVPPAPVQWDISIAYGVLHNNKWSAKRLSAFSLLYPPTPVDPDTLVNTYDPGTTFTFRPSQSGGSQRVDCYYFTSPPPPPPPPLK